MRFAIDATTWSNPRGYGRFTREIVRALVRTAPQHTYVLCVDRTVPRSELPEEAEVVDLITSVPPGRAAAHDGRRSMADMWRVSARLARTDPDAFFFPTVYTYVPIVTRRPVVVAIHDAIPERNPALTFVTRRSRWFWNAKVAAARAQADVIVTVSATSRDRLMEHFGLSSNRLAVVSEAPASVFSPRDAEAQGWARHRAGLGSSEPFILYVGGISPHKNLPRLVEAVAQATRGLEPAPIVALAGEVADDVFHTDRAAVERAAEAAGMADRIRFLGFVPDEALAALYTAAALVVLPSLDEGFGLPAIEAMSCGAAVAASRAGSLPEVVGTGGVLFDPLDTPAMSEAIGTALADPLNRELRSRGLARARQFTWDASGTMLAQVLAGAVERGRV